MWLSYDLGIWPLASIGRDLGELLAVPPLPSVLTTTPPPPLCDWFNHNYFSLLLLLFSTSTTVTATYALFCCCLLLPFAASVCGTAFSIAPPPPPEPLSGCQPYFHCRFIHPFFFHFFHPLSSSLNPSSAFFTLLLGTIPWDFACRGLLRRWYCSRHAPSASLGSPSILPFLPSPHYSSLRPPPRPFHPPSITTYLSPIYHRRTPSRHRDSCCLLSLSPRTHSFSSLLSFLLRYPFFPFPLPVHPWTNLVAAPPEPTVLH